MAVEGWAGADVASQGPCMLARHGGAETMDCVACMAAHSAACAAAIGSAGVYGRGALGRGMSSAMHARNC